MASEEFLDHIRNKAKCNLADQRSLKRSALLNSSRFDLKAIENKIKPPSLHEFKELCKTYVKFKRPQDLKRIRLGLCGGDQYILTLLSSDKALYSLVGSLTGGNAKLQMEALYCFINLGLTNQAQCLKVCEKIGAYLISLGTDNIHLQDLCLWIFGNLCGSHPKVCSMARGQGLEQELMRGLSSADESVVHSAAYTFNQYFDAAPYRIKEFVNGEVIKNMIDALKTNKDAIKDLCWCLFTVSTQKSFCPVLANFGVAKIALLILSDSLKDLNFDVNIATSLVRLLSNIVAVVNNVSIEVCYQADIFVAVSCQLLHCQYLHLRKEVTQLIANVINGAQAIPSTGPNILEDFNIIKRLEPALMYHFASQFSLSEPQLCFS